MIGGVATVHKKTERGLYARQCETTEAEGYVSRACIHNVCRAAHGSKIPEIVLVIACFLVRTNGVNAISVIINICVYSLDIKICLVFCRSIATQNSHVCKYITLWVSLFFIETLRR